MAGVSVVFRTQMRDVFHCKTLHISKCLEGQLIRGGATPMFAGRAAFNSFARIPVRSGTASKFASTVLTTAALSNSFSSFCVATQSFLSANYSHAIPLIHGFVRLFSASSSCSLSSSFSSSASWPSSSASLAQFPAALSRYEFAMTESTKVLADGLLAGDRLSLSRAITLIESSLEEHQQQGNALLLYVIRQSKAAREDRLRHDQIKTARIQHSQADVSPSSAAASPSASISSFAPSPSSVDGSLPSSSSSASSVSAKKIRLRIGISGSPGAGKSTFIESFGCYLISLGYRLAVLSIDPSSKRTGGSILGDKTRMAELSKNEAAYIRPSPSRGFLGGVAAATAESIVLCECAGFDLVLVETVGVGQSETSVSDMCDLMLLLVNPGGGDELQGMKKGIVEVADAIIVTKADGALLPTARNTKSDYSHAVHLMAYSDDDWRPRVAMISSVERRETGEWTSMEKVWTIVQEFHDFMGPGRLEEKRAQQRSESLWSAVNDICVQKIHEATELQPVKAAIETQLHQAHLTPRLAANILVEEFLHHAQEISQHKQRQQQ